MAARERRSGVDQNNSPRLIAPSPRTRPSTAAHRDRAALRGGAARDRSGRPRQRDPSGGPVRCATPERGAIAHRLSRVADPRSRASERLGWRSPDARLAWALWPVIGGEERRGVSGATLTRPALERLRDRAAEGRFEVLVCHAPDQPGAPLRLPGAA